MYSHKESIPRSLVSIRLLYQELFQLRLSQLGGKRQRGGVQSTNQISRLGTRSPVVTVQLTSGRYWATVPRSLVQNRSFCHELFHWVQTSTVRAAAGLFRGSVLRNHVSLALQLSAVDRCM